MREDAVTDIVAGVRAWWAAARRDLPWRHSRDPWAVLVSEVMLQQTQVARVQPLWERFMLRFPTAADVVSAPLGEVIEFWAGLGYNRRAVLLKRCAAVVVHEHGGVVPETLDGLLALPGIGPYTARAVLAFAYERDVAVVDTNVGRVLARLHGRTLAGREVQEAADALVPVGAGWEWNQALLDFGAMVCTKRAPRCATCPLAERCVWAGVGSDPAVGSAAVARAQSPFAGSDRRGRGRLVRALRADAVRTDSLSEVMGWAGDHARARRVADAVIADGLAVRVDDELRIP